MLKRHDFRSFYVLIPFDTFSLRKIRNYCTYIRAYLDYLTNILHKSPEDVSWEELRDDIRWLQKSRNIIKKTV